MLSYLALLNQPPKYAIFNVRLYPDAPLSCQISHELKPSCPLQLLSVNLQRINSRRLRRRLGRELHQRQPQRRNTRATIRIDKPMLIKLNQGSQHDSLRIRYLSRRRVDDPRHSRPVIRRRERVGHRALAKVPQRNSREPGAESGHPVRVYGFVYPCATLPTPPHPPSAVLVLVVAIVPENDGADYPEFGEEDVDEGFSSPEELAVCEYRCYHDADWVGCLGLGGGFIDELGDDGF